MEDFFAGLGVEGVDFLGEDGVSPAHEEVFEEGGVCGEDFEEGVLVAGDDASGFVSCGVPSW